MKQTYTPAPIDTSAIVLPEDIVRLGEKLAMNVHENYVQLRLSQGWTYGTTRNDQKKENPCMVPYDQLSEDEKESDRRTSMETLKTILALGYEIRKIGE